jgi:hypothetical protein
MAIFRQLTRSEYDAYMEYCGRWIILLALSLLFALNTGVTSGEAFTGTEPNLPKKQGTPSLNTSPQFYDSGA